MERNVLVVRLLVAAVLVAGLALIVSQVSGGSGYTVTAQFRDAGQLVKGGVVQVGGKNVGTIGEIDLSDDGLASIEMKLDDSVKPLRQGTRAQIRALGLSGIANRFIDLAPGPSTGAEIADGGTLGLTETQGIVDLDAVLSSLGPDTRKDLQSLIRNGGKLFDDGAAEDLNQALEYVDPFFAQGAALNQELTRDTQALMAMIGTGAQTAKVLADKRSDVAAGLDGTAATLSAIAAEQASLGGILEKSPAGMRRSGRALDSIGRTLDAISPAFSDLSKASPSLASTLRQLPPTTRRLRPVLAQLRSTLPALDTALRRLPALAKVGVPALNSTSSTIIAAAPIITGLRPYAPDVIGGLANGFGGTAANTYDANGHMARIALGLGGQVSGGLAGLLGAGGANTAPGLTQTKFLSRCPGTAAPTLSDGSNPYAPEGSDCNKEQVRP